MDDASKYVFVLLLALYCNYEHLVQCLHSFAEAFGRQMYEFIQPHTHSRRERGGVEDAEKVHVRVYFAIVFLFLLMVKFRMSRHTRIHTIPKLNPCRSRCMCSNISHTHTHTPTLWSQCVTQPHAVLQ